MLVKFCAEYGPFSTDRWKYLGENRKEKKNLLIWKIIPGKSKNRIIEVDSNEGREVPRHQSCPQNPTKQPNK